MARTARFNQDLTPIVVCRVDDMYVSWQTILDFGADGAGLDTALGVAAHYQIPITWAMVSHRSTGAYGMYPSTLFGAGLAPYEIVSHSYEHFARVTEAEYLEEVGTGGVTSAKDEIATLAAVVPKGFIQPGNWHTVTAYDSGATYNKGEIVTSGGLTYVSIGAGSWSNKPPATEPTYWTETERAFGEIATMADLGTPVGQMLQANYEWSMGYFPSAYQWVVGNWGYRYGIPFSDDIDHPVTQAMIDSYLATVVNTPGCIWVPLMHGVQADASNGEFATKASIFAHYMSELRRLADEGKIQLLLMSEAIAYRIDKRRVNLAPDETFSQASLGSANMPKGPWRGGTNVSIAEVADTVHGRCLLMDAASADAWATLDMWLEPGAYTLTWYQRSDTAALGSGNLTLTMQSVNAAGTAATITGGGNKTNTNKTEWEKQTATFTIPHAGLATRVAFDISRPGGNTAQRWYIDQVKCVLTPITRSAATGRVARGATSGSAGGGVPPPDALPQEIVVSVTFFSEGTSADFFVLNAPFAPDARLPYDPVAEGCSLVIASAGYSELITNVVYGLASPPADTYVYTSPAGTLTVDATYSGVIKRV